MKPSNTNMWSSTLYESKPAIAMLLDDPSTYIKQHILLGNEAQSTVDGVLYGSNPEQLRGFRV